MKPPGKHVQLQCERRAFRHRDGAVKNLPGSQLGATDHDRRVGQHRRDPSPHRGVLRMALVVSPPPRAVFVTAVQRELRRGFVLPEEPLRLRQPDDDLVVGAKADAKGDANRRWMANVRTRHLEVVGCLRDIALIAAVDIRALVIGGVVLDVRRLRLNTQRVRGIGRLLRFCRHVAGRREHLRTRMEDASAVLAVRRLALIVENLLRRTVWRRPPCDRTASNRSRVGEIPALKVDDGRVGNRACRPDNLSANPINELGSLRHASRFLREPAGECLLRAIVAGDTHGLVGPRHSGIKKVPMEMRVAENDVRQDDDLVFHALESLDRSIG